MNPLAVISAHASPRDLPYSRPPWEGSSVGRFRPNFRLRLHRDHLQRCLNPRIDPSQRGGTLADKCEDQKQCGVPEHDHRGSARLIRGPAPSIGSSHRRNARDLVPREAGGMHCQILLSRNEFGFLAESDIVQADRDACRRQLATPAAGSSRSLPQAARDAAVSSRLARTRSAVRCQWPSASPSRRLPVGLGCQAGRRAGRRRLRRPSRGVGDPGAEPLRLGGRMKDHDRNSANFHVRCLP
ncbi:MAG: hypothetical protein QOE41_1671 [Mycobacterium sp.]|nr:hypothetical protein [Mycobacterium sp.]